MDKTHIKPTADTPSNLAEAEGVAVRNEHQRNGDDVSLADFPFLPNEVYRQRAGLVLLAFCAVGLLLAILLMATMVLQMMGWI